MYTERFPIVMFEPGAYSVLEKTGGFCVIFVWNFEKFSILSVSATKSRLARIEPGNFLYASMENAC
jgi:hypothetical protein